MELWAVAGGAAVGATEVSAVDAMVWETPNAVVREPKSLKQRSSYRDRMIRRMKAKMKAGR